MFLQLYHYSTYCLEPMSLGAYRVLYLTDSLCLIHIFALFYLWLKSLLWLSLVNSFCYVSILWFIYFQVSMLYAWDLSPINIVCRDLVWFSVCNLRAFVLWWLNPFILMVIMDIFRWISNFLCFLFTLPDTFWLFQYFFINYAFFPSWFLRNLLLSSSFHNLII